MNTDAIVVQFDYLLRSYSNSYGILVGFTATLLLGGWLTLQDTMAVGAYSGYVYDPKTSLAIDSIR